MLLDVGKTVVVIGRQDSIYFSEIKGRIHCIHHYHDLYGIDFISSTLLMSSVYARHLHDLSGNLFGKTGYWVREELVTLFERKPTGFGEFIKKIENDKYQEF